MTGRDVDASASATGAASASVWRRARGLVVATLAWNVIEAGVAVASGVVAGSVALVGFGLDSVIESAAAAVVLARLGAMRAHRDLSKAAERRVLRFVGVTFMLLAVYVVGQAGWILWTQTAPAESDVGIALAALSLLVMPSLAIAKLRAAAALGSAALRAEAKETLACAWLSAALLLGLLARATLGWWWADPIAALAMVPWLVREGREALAGESCCDDD